MSIPPSGTDRSQYLNDTRLSWGARGLLAFLLSKPSMQVIDLTTWEDASYWGLDGRHSFDAPLDELRALGYVETDDVSGNLLAWPEAGC